MTFAAPLPFEEVLKIARNKRLLPTSLSSRELRELGGDVTRRAVLSARVDCADDLQLIGDLAAKIAGGITEAGAVAGAHVAGADRMISIPEAKAQILEHLKARGYDPGDDAGTIKDLSSDARRQLQVETSVLDMLGAGGWQAGQDPAALDVNPALELIRVTPARMPRDWAERWGAALDATLSDGATSGGDGARMVALKNHPIWQAIGDGAGDFMDTLGNPWPPFAFNSGMGVIEVSRDDAMELGIIDQATQIPPESRGLNDTLQVSGNRFSEALQKQIAARDDLRLKDGILTLKGRAS